MELEFLAWPPGKLKLSDQIDCLPESPGELLEHWKTSTIQPTLIFKSIVCSPGELVELPYTINGSCSTALVERTNQKACKFSHCITTDRVRASLPNLKELDVSFKEIKHGWSFLYVCICLNTLDCHEETTKSKQVQSCLPWFLMR